MTIAGFQISIKPGAWCSPTLLCLHSFKHVISTTDKKLKIVVSIKTGGSRQDDNLSRNWTEGLLMSLSPPKKNRVFCYHISNVSSTKGAGRPRGECFRLFFGSECNIA